jgi:hypothetical protein
MPKPVGSKSRGSVDILSVSIVGFLVLSLTAIVSVVVNPNVKQLFSSKAFMYKPVTNTNAGQATGGAAGSAALSSGRNGTTAAKSTTPTTTRNAALTTKVAEIQNTAKDSSITQNTTTTPITTTSVSPKEPASTTIVTGGYSREEALKVPGKVDVNEAGYDCKNNPDKCKTGADVSGFYELNGRYYPIGGTGNNPSDPKYYADSQAKAIADAKAAADTARNAALAGKVAEVQNTAPTNNFAEKVATVQNTARDSSIPQPTTTTTIRRERRDTGEVFITQTTTETRDAEGKIISTKTVSTTPSTSISVSQVDGGYNQTTMSYMRDMETGLPVGTPTVTTKFIPTPPTASIEVNRQGGVSLKNQDGGKCEFNSDCGSNSGCGGGICKPAPIVQIPSNISQIPANFKVNPIVGGTQVSQEVLDSMQKSMNLLNAITFNTLEPAAQSTRNDPRSLNSLLAMAKLTGVTAAETAAAVGTTYLVPEIITVAPTLIAQAAPVLSTIGRVVSAAQVAYLTYGAAACAQDSNSATCHDAQTNAVIGYTTDAAGFTQMFNSGLQTINDSLAVVKGKALTALFGNIINKPPTPTAIEIDNPSVIDMVKGEGGAWSYKPVNTSLSLSPAKQTTTNLLNSNTTTQAVNTIENVGNELASARTTTNAFITPALQETAQNIINLPSTSSEQNLAAQLTERLTTVPEVPITPVVEAPATITEVVSTTPVVETQPSTVTKVKDFFVNGWKNLTSTPEKGDALNVGKIAENITPKTSTIVETIDEVTPETPAIETVTNITGHKAELEVDINNPEVPTNKIAKSITGLEPKDSEMTNVIIENHLSLKEKYGLPPREMRFDDPELYKNTLEEIARQNGIEVRFVNPTTDKVFQMAPMAGAYAETNNIIIRSDLNPKDYLGSFEHELVHALQNKIDPNMSVEQKEFEAFITANISINPDNLTTDIRMKLFDQIAGSIKYNYEERGIANPWELTQTAASINPVTNTWNKIKNSLSSTASQLINDYLQHQYNISVIFKELPENGLTQSEISQYKPYIRQWIDNGLDGSFAAQDIAETIQTLKEYPSIQPTFITMLTDNKVNLSEYGLDGLVETLSKTPEVLRNEYINKYIPAWTSTNHTNQMSTSALDNTIRQLNKYPSIQPTFITMLVDKNVNLVDYNVSPLMSQLGSDSMSPDLRNEYINKYIPSWITTDQTNAGTLGSIVQNAQNIARRTPEIRYKLLNTYIPTLLKENTSLESVADFTSLLSSRSNKIIKITEILDHIPPKEWVSLVQKFDLYELLPDFQDQVAQLISSSGDAQKMAVQKFSTDVQNVNTAYDSFTQKLISGSKPETIQDYDFLYHYLNSSKGELKNQYGNVQNIAKVIPLLKKYPSVSPKFVTTLLDKNSNLNSLDMLMNTLSNVPETQRNEYINTYIPAWIATNQTDTRTLDIAISGLIFHPSISPTFVTTLLDKNVILDDSFSGIGDTLIPTLERMEPSLRNEYINTYIPSWIATNQTNTKTLNSIVQHVRYIFWENPEIRSKFPNMYIPSLLKENTSLESIDYFISFFSSSSKYSTSDNVQITQILDVLPPKLWITLTKRFDLYKLQIPDFQNQVTQLTSSSGNAQKMAVQKFSTDIQNVNNTYTNFVQSLSFGSKPETVQDYNFLDYYLNSIDEDYSSSYNELINNFAITNWQSKSHAEVLQEISQELTTVPLNPMEVTFKIQLQDVTYSAPDNLITSLQSLSAPTINVSAQDQAAAITYLEKQYSSLSDAKLGEIIANGPGSAANNQILNTISFTNKEQAMAKINGILKSNLSNDLKTQNLRDLISAQMDVPENYINAAIGKLFSETDTDTLLTKLINNSITPTEKSLLVKKLPELTTTYLQDFISEHPGLTGFQKTLENTDLWKTIKQINSETFLADQSAQKYTKDISLVLSDRTLLDVWQGVNAGTCLGDCPAFLAKRDNIVPVKMVKDGEVFGNALFIIQPNKFILAGFDPSESFASAVTSEKMNEFIDESMKAFLQMADKNSWEFMIGIPNEVGGLSNRGDDIGKYIAENYTKNATVVSIQPEGKLQPVYGYEPKNAYQIDPSVLSKIRNSINSQSSGVEPDTSLVNVLNKYIVEPINEIIPGGTTSKTSIAVEAPVKETTATKPKPTFLQQAHDWLKTNIKDEQGWLPWLRVSNPAPVVEARLPAVAHVVEPANKVLKLSIPTNLLANGVKPLSGDLFDAQNGAIILKPEDNVKLIRKITVLKPVADQLLQRPSVTSYALQTYRSQELALAAQDTNDLASLLSRNWQTSGGTDNVLVHTSYSTKATQDVGILSLTPTPRVEITYTLEVPAKNLIQVQRNDKGELILPNGITTANAYGYGFIPPDLYETEIAFLLDVPVDYITNITAKEIGVNGEIQERIVYQKTLPPPQPAAEVKPTFLQNLVNNSFLNKLVGGSSVAVLTGKIVVDNWNNISQTATNFWQSLPFNKSASPYPSKTEVKPQTDANNQPPVSKFITNNDGAFVGIPPQTTKNDPSVFATEVAKNPSFFGIPKDKYNQIFSDGILTADEKRYLYENYYTPSPNSFLGSATNYGGVDVAVATLFFNGQNIRDQMSRGWVMTASGEYGYHDDLLGSMKTFDFIFNKNPNRNDSLLQNQASTIYAYYADKNRLSNGQPASVTYDQLNERQKRIYDLTNVSMSNFKKEKLDTIANQSKLNPEQALNSGKYIGIVATKSVNDIGRRLLLYKKDVVTNKPQFVGVVLVGDTAKRADWIGSGAVTEQANANFVSYPLGTRVQNGEQWAIDLTQDLYKYYGGSGGPAYGVIAIDPDAQDIQITQNGQQNNQVNQTKTNNISVPQSSNVQDPNSKIINSAISTMNNCQPGYSGFYNACDGGNYKGRILQSGDIIDTNFGSKPPSNPVDLYWCTSLVKDAAKASDVQIDGNFGANDMYQNFSNKKAVTLTENANLGSQTTPIKSGMVAFVTKASQPGYIGHVGIVSNIQVVNSSTIFVTIVQANAGTVQATYQLDGNGNLVNNVNGQNYYIRGFGDILKYGKST